MLRRTAGLLRLRPQNLLVRPFATAFDPEKFSKRFEADQKQIEDYYRHIEKQSWAQHKALPLKRPSQETENYIASRKGYRQIVLGDKVVTQKMMKWLGPVFWIMRELKDVYAVLVTGRNTDDNKHVELPNGADYGALLRAIANGKESHPYFRDWYRLVYMFSTFHKPLITCMSGKTAEAMVGLLVHTPYRIAFTDSMMFMPQTEHGFFPDSGLTYFLPRLDGALGMYLALTGKKLFGSDLVHCGVATHFLDPNQMPDLCDALEENSGFYSVVPSILERFDRSSIKGAPFSLAPHQDLIDRCFSKGSVPEIFQALEAEKGADDAQFAQATLRVLSRKSPLSLKTTHEALQKGGELSLGACLKMEYNIALNMIQTVDFKEGATSVLEGRSPRWSYPSVKEVPDSVVTAMFARQEAAAGGSALTLSLPGLDYDPDSVRRPDWAKGEMWAAESLDEEAARLSAKAKEAAQKFKETRDQQDSWFEFSPHDKQRKLAEMPYNKAVKMT